MGFFDKNKFQSGKQEYETPDALFDKINKEFDFDLDVCADNKNTKCAKFFTEEQDALIQTWSGTCWMNPPYNATKDWIKKAYLESRKEDCTVVCLIPAKTNTNWWHEYCMLGEIRFLRGRPKFKGCVHGLPFPLAIVIFSKNIVGNYKGISVS